jgi:hypothetical protein
LTGSREPPSKRRPRGRCPHIRRRCQAHRARARPRGLPSTASLRHCFRNNVNCSEGDKVTVNRSDFD